MGERMNKAAEIRAMFIECPQWTTRQIADVIGVDTAYVRAVRQRLDPTIRKRSVRAQLARQNTGDKGKAREAAQTACKKLHGRNRRAAYNKAYVKFLRLTGSKAAAREAWRQ